MNCRYFACPACWVYIDAGYRWAYWLLEDTGIVTMNGAVDVRAVMNHEEYWNPPADSQSTWLRDRVLPAVRAFIEQHENHGMVYTEEDVIACEDALYYNWKQLET